MGEDLRLWVVDSSSLIQVRQAGISQAKQAAVYKRLEEAAKADCLIFPSQVRHELEWVEADHPGDQALAWVRRVRDIAERAANLATVQRILAKAPQLIDPASTRDAADPYVIALALDSIRLGGVSILSDDRVDRPDGRGGVRKLSVATVAAIYDVPVVPLTGFMLRFLDSR